MKLPLPILFLAFNFLLFQQLKAQDSTNTTPRITIKSFQKDGKDVKESIKTIDIDDLDNALIILDSVLGESGINLKNIHSRLGELNLLEGDFSSIDGFLDSLSQVFNFSLDTNIPKKKVSLGVIINDNTHNEEAKTYLPLILEVIAGSPADKSGLKKGDYIFELDQQRMHHIEDIKKLISQKKENDSLAIRYIRNQDTLNTVAFLKCMEKRQENWLSLMQRETSKDSCTKNPAHPFCEKIIIQKSGPRLGLKIKELNEEGKKALKAKNGKIIVTEVFHKSLAERMGLQINDVILSVNGHVIQNTMDLKNYIDQLQIPHPVEIKYIRYGKKKKVSGVIDEYSKPWDENAPMNIIDLSKVKH
ncbi:MAG: PDZ domain-containing protein [Chitinophagales bacterium]|nr:PDZ domain-containing protein [Chitinophagales bacterium]